MAGSARGLMSQLRDEWEQEEALGDSFHFLLLAVKAWIFSLGLRFTFHKKPISEILFNNVWRCRRNFQERCFMGNEACIGLELVC